MTAPRAFRLAEIVAQLGGELAGDPDVTVGRVASLQAAGPGAISFLSQPMYRPQLHETRATAVIVPRSERDATDLPRILCDDPYLYFARVSALLNPPEAFEPGIHPSAVVEPWARIAASARVGDRKSVV
jgi:UDP-3-O-[3-hydroxymyristoyl] glucosamine N-acyltransferase